MTPNPTAAPCPICGPECHCVTAARGSSEGATWTDVDIDVDSLNPLAVYQSLTAEREERIRQLEATIVDRDRLIAHLRERYEWLRGKCEGLIDCIHSPGVARSLRDYCEEPTP